MPLPRTDRLLLLGLVVVNLVLKLAWSGVNELAHDEPFTVFWSQRPWNELWAMFRTENNPPLYFLVIKAWSAVVPFEASWLRVPSAACSALAVWPLFLLARHFGSRGAALLAGLLFTFSNYHYGFAHEVRAYPLFTLLTNTSLLLLVRTTQRPGSAVQGMLLLTLLNLTLVYTHFFGWLVVGLQGLLVLALPMLRPLRRSFLFGTVLTAIGFLPYALVFTGRMSQSVVQGTWLAPPVPEELYNMVWRWSNAPVLVVVFLAFIVAAWWKDRLRSVGLRFAVLWAFVPLLGMFMVSFVVPMFLDRYLVFAAPGFALLVALSVEILFPNAPLRTGVFAALGLGMAATFTPWKDSGLHPSQVVRVEQALCGGSCSVEVLPRWYWITHLAAQDPRSLQLPTAQHMAYRSEVGRPGAAQVPAAPPDTVPVALVIDAGAHWVDPERRWYRELRAIYPRVDSVEATPKVWVYRFSR